MALYARLNGPPLLSGRGMIVVCGYRGGGTRKEPWGAGRLGRLTLHGFRSFIAACRDQAANPRNLNYQVELVEDVLLRAGFSQVRVLMDQDLVAQAPIPEIKGVTLVQPVVIRELTGADFGGVDTVVVVYPDAIGLSWGALEKTVLGLGRTLIVVNGRRRIFTITRDIHRRLQGCRFLAETRIVEILGAAILFPVAAGLAAYDALCGTRP